MEIPAKYYAAMEDGKMVYVCSHHVSKIAVKGKAPGRMSPKRGVRFIGTLNQYTAKKCAECRKGPSIDKEA
jgi:hypothetical protein